jgi:superfamily II DNA or RNA helicase
MNVDGLHDLGEEYAQHVLLADFNFTWTPSTRHARVDDALRELSNLPSAVPASLLPGCLEFVDEHIAISDLTVAEKAVENVDDQYICPIAVSYHDGRKAAHLTGVAFPVPVVSYQYFATAVRRQLQLGPGDAVVLGCISPRSWEPIKLFDPSVRFNAVYPAGSFLYSAYIVPSASRHYVMVTVRDFSTYKVICPPAMLALDRKPDVMSFSMLAEQRKLFNTLLRPYHDAGDEVMDVPFMSSYTAHNGPHAPPHYTIRVASDAHVTRYGFRLFSGYAVDAMLKSSQAIKGVMRWSAVLVNQARLQSARWHDIKTKYIRKQYYGETDDEVTYHFALGPGTLRIRATGKKMVAMLYPPCSLDVKGVFAWELSRQLTSCIFSPLGMDQESLLNMIGWVSRVDVQPAQQPRRLKTLLRPHQLTSLGFMLAKESSTRSPTIAESLWARLPTGGWYSGGWYGSSSTFAVTRQPPMNAQLRGGLLADAMGLGKTCEVIALCLANPPESTAANRATLVLCPASLLQQWHDEIRKHAGEALGVLIYHGKNKHGVTRQSIATDYDVVIMSYNTYASAVKSQDAVVNNLCWHRVVYDESHTMSATITQCPPKSKNAWLVSATPLKNIDRQLGALGLPGDICRRVMNESQSSATFVLLNIMCRHTAEDAAMQLPSVHQKVIKVHLEAEERAVYDELNRLTRQRANSNGITALGIMNAVQGLRSVCAGGVYDVESLKACTTGKHDKADPNLRAPNDDVCAVCMEGYEQPTLTSCQHWFCRECIEASLQFKAACPMCRRLQTKSNLRYGVRFDFKESEAPPVVVRCTSKHAAVLRLVEQAKQNDPYAKICVFASHTASIAHLETELQAAGRGVVSIKGTTDVSRRSKLLAEFQAASGIDVCLLTMRCASSGLNLMGANVVIFADVSLNPEMVDQAIGRVWRQGQQREVWVYHVVAANTLEERAFDHLQSFRTRPSKENLISFL